MCVCAVGLTCRNASSRLSVGEGMSCCTEIRLAMGDLGGGIPRLVAAGARRPPRHPPRRLAGFRLLPCWWIGIHAPAMVVVFMLCFENVRVVTGRLVQYVCSRCTVLFPGSISRL